MNPSARGTAYRRLALLAAAGVLLPTASAVAMSTAGSGAAAAPATNATVVPVGSATNAVSGVGGLTSATAAAKAVASASMGQGPTGGSSPSGAPSAEETPVVFGPLLGLFKFGAGIGLPLVCQAGTSGMGSGAGELGVAEQAAPVIQAINDGCDTASTNGVMFVEMGQEMAAPAVALNPFLNPVIESVAVAAEEYGTAYGEELSPFGPTVAGSGNTVRWLKGK